MRNCTSLLVLLSCTYASIAAEYHVAPGGDDDATGDADHPWASFKVAAQRAKAGDLVVVHAGTYRPGSKLVQWGGGAAGNPVVFRAAPGERPVISALQVLDGWQPAGDDRWRAAMPWTLASEEVDGNALNGSWPGRDQLFMDGQMLVEARWPDLPADRAPWQQRREDFAAVTAVEVGERSTDKAADGLYRTRATYRFAPGTLPTLSDWSTVGICVLPGGHWITLRGEVIARDGDQLTVDIAHSHELDGSYQPKASDRVFLWGHPDLISQAGEWCRDPTDGTVILQSTQDPRDRLVEAKGHILLIHWWKRGNLRFEGLHFVGGRLLQQADQDDDDPESITFIDCDFRYNTHGQAPYNGRYYQIGKGDYAVTLSGDHCRLQDCTIERIGGLGLSVSGADLLVDNSVVRHTGYVGVGGAMSLSGPRPTVQHCTMREGGSGGLGLRPGSGGARIRHNDLGHYYRIGVDGAILRFAGDVSGDDGSGSRSIISDNRIHDVHAPTGSGFYGATGIYLEGGEDRIDIHHNVIWNTTHGAMKMRGLGDVRIVHNSCAEYLNNFGGTFTGTRISNNLFAWAYRRPDLAAGGVVDGNCFLSTGTGFNGEGAALTLADNHYAADPGLRGGFGSDERPAADSPLRDRAVELGDGLLQPPVTDGLPDIGAFETDAQPPGRQGAVFRTSDAAAVLVDRLGPGRYRLTGLDPDRPLPADAQLQIGAAAAGGSWSEPAFIDVPELVGDGQAIWLQLDQETILLPGTVDIAATSDGRSIQVDIDTIDGGVEAGLDDATWLPLPAEFEELPRTEPHLLGFRRIDGAG